VHSARFIWKRQDNILQPLLDAKGEENAINKKIFTRGSFVSANRMAQGAQLILVLMLWISVHAQQKLVLMEANAEVNAPIDITRTQSVD